MNKRKNLLLIIPNLDFGGAQKSISKLSFEFEKTHNVFLCVFNTETGIAFPHGGELLNLEVKAGENIIDKIIKFNERVRKLKQLKKSKNITISISFLEGADYVNILSKRRNERTIASIRGSKLEDGDIKGILGWFRKKIFIPILYNFADKIITVSEGIKNELNKSFYIPLKKITVIYNFYDFPLIINQGEESIPTQYRNLFDSNKILINAGRFHVAKNFEALIAIYALLISDFNLQKTKLVLLGDGADRNKLLTFAKNKKLKVYSSFDNDSYHENYDVYFIGFDSNPIKYIAKSTLFLLTSSWEGFPNSLAEAMIVNTPVISTDCQTGPREIIAPGTNYIKNLTTSEKTNTGILLPVLRGKNYNNFVQLWAETINNLIADNDNLLLYSVNGKKRIGDFKLEKIIKEWYHVIQ